MDMTGEYRIQAPRAAVWAALNDPETLKQVITGCEELTKVSDTEFHAKVTAKVGPVKAKFGGKILLSDLDPPNGYTINGEGQGGAAGFAKGGAKVRLEEVPEGTLLKYEVHAQIGGKLAQIGSRLIDGAAHKMADEFFGDFAQVVQARAAEASAAGAVDAAATGAATVSPGPVREPEPAAMPKAQPAAAETPPSQTGLPPVVWISGLIVVVGGALWYFLRR
jgi:carbon monoxide dehydrogenase subunit G